MFITIGNIAQYTTYHGGLVMLKNIPGARQATAMEAAECVNRLIINMDPHMTLANKLWEKIYGTKPQPRKEKRHSDIFDHLFDSETGEVL